ncbi:MAG: leucine-rich repeat domain-containing protein [Pirellulaceae bacterium]
MNDLLLRRADCLARSKEQTPTRPSLCPTRLALLFILCLMLPVAAREAAGRAVEGRESGDVQFRAALTALAEKSGELGLTDAAVTTEAWYVPRDPRRHYLFLPPADDPARPAPNATQLVTFWHAKFADLRQQQAERLFDLARAEAEAGNEGVAYRLLHEVLREDPDHAGARQVLDYTRGERGWRHPARRPQARRNRATHPLFGWPSDQYWVVDSQHFEVATNLHVRGGRQVAEYLERVHSAWRQLFYEYWTVPGRLAARFRGEEVALGPARVFKVVLFRDRQEYVQQLSQSEPQIEMSIGYYSQSHKMAFFYADDELARATWVHEVTHQFFQESGEVAPQVAERSNFWVVEGVALYMESLADHGGYFTTGGVDADRLQYARYRCLNEGYYLPLEKLVGYGREQLQKEVDLPKLYSQCAGLTHCFMDAVPDAQMRSFIAYLRTVYRGVGQQQTLSSELGRTYLELDQQYRESLNVKDDDLVYVDPRVQNLCLGHTHVTDAGLTRLRGVERLLWLDLSFTATGDAGVARFAGARQLSQLNLEGTRITAAGLDTVGEFRQLEELDLSQTAVEDDDLAKLVRLTRLKVLWLTGTPISDAGLAFLGSLRHLEQLDVTGTAVSQAGIQNLKRRLPKLK